MRSDVYISGCRVEYARGIRGQHEVGDILNVVPRNGRRLVGV